jgi:hypothetical protein
MCDGMRIDRRLVLIGVMVIVLSMTMATQYATTKIGYSYAIVHPSDADIRFIGSDNSSDQIRVLRVENNASATARYLKIELGNISVNTNKTYTAAFGIVNEESYNITITHINVSASDGADYMQIWLHGDRDARADVDAGTSVLVWNKISVGYDATSSVWGLAAGDQNSSSMDGTSATTSWDDTAGVRYSTYETPAVNNTDDYVWVQISLDVPQNADTSDSFTGTIYVHTRATTHDE